MPDTTVKSLLEAGVHFGHQTSRWNPQMEPFLFGARGGVHIIDLEQTVGYLKDAEAFAEKTAKDGGKILFVGTKRQGKAIIKEAAVAAGMPYIIERWLGGTLTNFPTIHERLTLLLRLRKEKADGDWERLPKKEVARKQDSLDRLEMLLGGMADLDKVPAAVFVGDVMREKLAVHEARKLKIPVIGVIDSNADPKGIDYPIPANDDAVGAIKLVTDTIAEAAGRGWALYLKQAAKDAEAAAKAQAAEAAKQAEEQARVEAKAKAKADAELAAKAKADPTKLASATKEKK
jgi:small subunit ribosomal protein S2